MGCVSSPELEAEGAGFMPLSSATPRDNSKHKRGWNTEEDGGQQVLCTPKPSLTSSRPTGVPDQYPLHHSHSTVALLLPHNHCT